MVGNEEIKVKGTWGGARPNTGGVRAGAGRKPLEGGKKRTILMTDFEYDFIRDALKKIRAGATNLDIEAYRAEWKPKEKD